MKKKKMVLLIVAAAAVLGISAFLYIQGKPKKTGPDGSSAPTAAASQLRFPVTREDLAGTIEVKGKSSYEKETWITAPFEADVKAWHAADGSQVSKGDILFVLDGTSLSADISQLEANDRKQELEAALARFQAAAGADDAGGAVSESDAKQRYAQTESRKLQSELNAVSGDASRQQLELKRSKLAQASFQAPEPGIFLFGETKQPQHVKEGERLGKVVDLTKLQLLTTVGEFDVFKNQPGMPVSVKVEALKGVTLKGKVERVSKFAKTGTEGGSGTAAAQFEVAVSLEPNDKLIAGLSLTGTIETERKTNVLVVPTLAVQHEKDQAYVMVLDGGAPAKRDITIGLETAEKTEVVSGLKEGETVVLE